jgi:hypothetical protein
MKRHWHLTLLGTLLTTAAIGLTMAGSSAHRDALATVAPRMIASCQLRTTIVKLDIDELRGGVQFLSSRPPVFGDCSRRYSGSDRSDGKVRLALGYYLPDFADCQGRGSSAHAAASKRSAQADDGAQHPVRIIACPGSTVARFYYARTSRIRCLAPEPAGERASHSRAIAPVMPTACSEIARLCARWQSTPSVTDEGTL